MNERLPEVESRAGSTACPHCGGVGVVDSGGFTPWGAHIDIPCPSCQEAERNKLAAFGASWIKDSSLERWFPITAEELAKAKATIADLRMNYDLLKRGTQQTIDDLGSRMIEAQRKAHEMEKLLREGISITPFGWRHNEWYAEVRKSFPHLAEPNR